MNQPPRELLYSTSPVTGNFTVGGPKLCVGPAGNPCCDDARVGCYFLSKNDKEHPLWNMKSKGTPWNKARCMAKCQSTGQPFMLFDTKGKTTCTCFGTDLEWDLQVTGGAHDYKNTAAGSPTTGMCPGTGCDKRAGKRKLMF